MPRIRTIKPEFFSNEEIGNLPAEARLLFIGLWTLADREGRLEDRPVRIKAQLFPYDELSINSGLEQIEAANLISRYEADDGKRCIQIINFTKHQHPHPKETAYGLPPPPQSRENSGQAGKGNEIQQTCPVDSHVLTHGSMEHGTLSPTPLPAESAAKPQKTSERESRSRFSLKECVRYAKSLKSIKSPEAYGKTIWRSGEDDDEVAGFIAGDSGKPPKKPPPPINLDELKQLATDLERMDLKGAADALRASIEAK